jgi:F0F1-type ATP synthase membrane subunit b/b'
MTEKQLLDLKQKINESKQTLSKLEGRRETLTEQLQEKYKVKTLKAAQKKAEEMKLKIEQWEQQIEQATDELEKQLQDGNLEA